MGQPSPDRLLGAGGIGLAILGVVIPFVWKDMPTYLSYPLVAVGGSLTLWSLYHAVAGHTAIRTWFGKAPTTAAAPPDLPTGAWHGNTYVLAAPLLLLTTIVKETDDRTTHIFRVDGPVENSMIDLRVTVDPHGDLRTDVVHLSNGEPHFVWDNFPAAYARKVRLPEDRLFALGVRVIRYNPAAAPVVVRVHMHSWTV